METKKTLYIFDLVVPENNEPFSYLGDILTEVSVFAINELEATKIISREFGSSITNRLQFRELAIRTLFGKVAQVGLKDPTHQEGVVHKAY